MNCTQCGALVPPDGDCSQCSLTTTEDDSAGNLPGAVWPPPISRAGIVETVQIPFKNIHRVIDGAISTFRVGYIEVAPAGTSLDGKRTLTISTMYWIILASAFLGLWIPVALLLEYAFRKNDTLNLDWLDVKEVGYEPKNNRICIVYYLPGRNGKRKLESLATKFLPDQYRSFESAIEKFAPSAVVRKDPAKTKAPFLGSAAGYFIVTAAVFYVILIAIIQLTSSHHAIGFAARP